MPFYAEECASMLAVTFSGGDKMLRSIVSASCALCSPSLSHRTPLRQHGCISQGRCSPAPPRPSSSSSPADQSLIGACCCWEIRTRTLNKPVRGFYLQHFNLRIYVFL